MTAELWDAPTATGPINAVVTVPGSKSVTNRALVLAALATGPSLLRRPLRARDTLLMADAPIPAQKKHTTCAGAGQNETPTSKRGTSFPARAAVETSPSTAAWPAR